MELIIALGLLVGLALAAARWGTDSREWPRSKEERLAGFGVRWEDRPAKVAPTSARPAVSGHAPRDKVMFENAADGRRLRPAP
jgi:hypothetical protein